jgi:hypothetical protein
MFLVCCQIGNLPRIKANRQVLEKSHGATY